MMGKVGIVDGKELLLFPAVRKDRNIRLPAEVTGCKKCCIAASGNINGAVRVSFRNTLKLTDHLIGME